MPKTLTCSECQESVSELLGHWYLFTSLGEKEKRFVCQTCIDAIKKKIATTATTSTMVSSPSQSAKRSHPLPPHMKPRYSEVLEEHLENLLDDMFE